MNICQSFDFDSVATGLPTFLGFYSRRKSNGEKESWEEACDRFLQGLRDLGDFSKEEFSLISKYARTAKSLPSGRWMWTGGSSWLNEKKNVFGAYNCTSLNLTGVEVFGTLMELSMMGCGTGAVLDPEYIKLLPVIKNPTSIYFTGSFGSIPKSQRKEASEMRVDFDNRVTITVGDSREGWVRSYQLLLQLASSSNFTGEIAVTIDISHVRDSGEALAGFGGVANPIKLKEMYSKCAVILNGAIGRQLDSLECCLLIDEGSAAVVAGNVRRSAGMRQFNSDDTHGLTAKDNLWLQDANGKWIIDPKRDSLRMANHSRVFHRKPTVEECLDSVKKQYFSGEGAIQNAAEAIARSNADILKNKTAKLEFLKAYEEDRSPRGKAATVLDKYCCQELGYSLFDRLHEEELYHRFARFGLNPCGEITGTDFTCNLSEIHLNQLDPTNFQEQEEAFTVGALSVSALLKHEFPVPVMQRSRELDPIVGVSFTGAFDFFVNALGVDWLRWWQKDRCQFFYGGIDTKIIQICAKFNIDIEYYRRDEQYQLGMLFEAIEKAYLSWWQSIVFKVVAAYCDRHKLKCPNRCTTVQPSGCLDKTALRVFDQGLLYADELMSPGSGETVNLKLSVRKGISVSTGIANQPLQLVKVILDNGRILRMTPNHRLSIDGNWVYAADMIPGMKIDFSLGEYQNEQEASLLNMDQFKYTREGRQIELGHSRGVTATIIKMPQIMSPDLSYFIGALFGDGCLSPSKYRIRFCRNDYALLERLQKIGQQNFALEGQIRKYSDREAFELSFASIQFFDWLQLNGLAKTEESQNLDRIPLAIRCSSRQSILSFFCGLIDTDGCIRSTGRISIDSASEKFLRNLQQIGESVGLCFSIFHNTQGKNKQAQKNMWGLCLSRMLSQPDALAYLNSNSQKAQTRPIPSPKRSFKFQPYTVVSVDWEETPEYSYDFAVEGTDDNDSWYWQGGVKSHNTKSLLTGASAGWHPPKAQRYIRRITYTANHPVALACRDFGYNIIPAQSSKDENGKLLDDIHDPRCTEWLVEIPVSVPWADLPGAEDIDVAQFSAIAQFDFYMRVQQEWTTHNTSATIEFREPEIPALSLRIHDAIKNNEGFISVALMARFDDYNSFPRLPFEPISKEVYEQMMSDVLERRITNNFYATFTRYDLESQGMLIPVGPNGCDGDKCEMPKISPA